ncbi:PH, RCC1 and FYVE domains-containing protein 1 [Vitis vinifera]|uniref:PH, RCC1 and FYVE domains-containing protein 1 n=1 Tax=Vitis vinifera TaxID=29760 RepID=A0A438D708_VITVI|nr:PH, RCC1 and FYVE domains-containing protein 1 [Vitis vinifera]
MADPQRNGLAERDVEQAIVALKKGAYLLKYGRRGKPKFCPFRLSNDESMLIWYSGKEEKQLKLNNVSRIIPGQRTDQMTFLSWLLMWFEAISGLRIGLDKSEILLVGRVENLEVLALEFGYKAGVLPSTYLGLPLGAPHKFVAVWDGVEERL